MNTFGTMSVTRRGLTSSQVTLDT